MVKLFPASFALAPTVAAKLSTGLGFFPSPTVQVASSHNAIASSLNLLPLELRLLI